MALKDKLAIAKMLLALRKLYKNSEHTDAVFDIGEALYRIGASDVARKRFESSPDSLEVIRSRKGLQPYDVHELQKLPPGTVGRAYADHMLDRQLDPNFFPEMKIKNDTIFVIMRLRQTHDLWHVITGFDTSILGEIGLQAFMAAQTSLPTSMILITGSLFKAAISQQDVVEPMMDMVLKGWTMGKNAKPIFALDWEAHWQTPLTELRSLYQIPEPWTAQSDSNSP